MILIDDAIYSCYMLDEGDVRGNFSHAYEAHIIAAANVPILQNVEAATGVERDETITIEVTTDVGQTWSRGFTKRFDPDLAACIFTTPNPYVLGIRVQGVALSIDVTRPDDPIELPVLPLRISASDVTGGRMFLADDLKVIAFDGVRVLWKSRRVSLDGIDGLSYSNGVVRGLATDVGAENVPFEIDATSGAVSGGFEDFKRLG